MQISVLGSGSKGNSVYIESGDSGVLIDAGFSGKQIEERLKKIGKDTKKLNGILLTHEHNDHIQGAGVLSRRLNIPLLANEGTIRGGEGRLGKIHKIYEFQTGEKFTFRDFEIRSFRLSHDTNDPVGFVVSNAHSTMGYCTDTGKVTHLMADRLSHCELLVLEFNHDLKMLKLGPYPPALQQRVRSSQGHLSNPDAANFLESIQSTRLHTVILAHLSETNNIPDLAMKAAGDVAANHKRKLILAKQDIPLAPISI